MELVMRKDIPEELTWDLTAIYQTEEDMYQDAKKLQTLLLQSERGFRHFVFRVQLPITEKLD